MFSKRLDKLSDIKISAIQGFFSRSLLFNEIINELFMFAENYKFCNFVDDNPFLSSEKKLSAMLENHKNNLKVML